MWLKLRAVYLGLPLAACLAVVAAGCGQAGKKEPPANAPKAAKSDADTQGNKGQEEESKHSGWWCDEHGIPEAECSLCSNKVADACKARGDWCARHNRARSQCFKCDPKLKEAFAARYRARYHKEPPPISDE
jgi:hypothetical protein